MGILRFSASPWLVDNTCSSPLISMIGMTVVFFLGIFDNGQMCSSQSGRCVYMVGTFCSGLRGQGKLHKAGLLIQMFFVENRSEALWSVTLWSWLDLVYNSLNLTLIFQKVLIMSSSYLCLELITKVDKQNCMLVHAPDTHNKDDWAKQKLRK